MSAFYKYCIVLLIPFSLIACSADESNLAESSVTDGGPHVLMVSFDGFRPDYPERWPLPNFQQLQREGSHARGLIPGYPSKTFPNHYSLVTGLYPGHHGLVDNGFYHPVLDKSYRMSDREAVEDPRFYGGDPLWQYLQQQGIPTASYFWVGSEAPIQGAYPSEYRLYDGSVENEDRVDTVLTWLALPAAERPRFVTLYFSLVDSAAHDHGPLSAVTREAAIEADRLLGLLMNGLQALPHAVDLVVVSDHGMYPVSTHTDSFIDLSMLRDRAGLDQVLISQTQAQVYVSDPHQEDSLYNALLAQQDERFRVYRKADTPAHWHYREQAAIGDLLIVAEPGYVLTEQPVPVPAASSAAEAPVIGVHGYDARGIPALDGIFYAWGPSISAGVRLPAVENVHVYPLILHLLRQPIPAGIDGDLHHLQDILLNEVSVTE